ncbi:hypothetical protein AB205_0196300 [Aquarana catesbeiana]|uniref:Uncharacterized protein n=1 Tax=Aquarana catesbeiana TaxID=8400 RepID=A0A2G9QMN0_AQUCT|nr:hypothetical protein AB205_0196300 [Aquarana catesbeiana]
MEIPTVREIIIPSLVQCVMDVSSLLKLETDFWRPWETPGTTPALCVRYAVKAWRDKPFLQRKINHYARSMLML